MIVYYCMGDGMGHVSEACAVLKALHPRASATLITSSPYAYKFAEPAGHDVESPPAYRPGSQSLTDWMHATIDRLEPDLLFLDDFPVGAWGELEPERFPKVPIHYVAAAKHWNRYHKAHANKLARMPTLAITYMVERLHADHWEWVRDHSTFTLSVRLPPVASITGASVVLSTEARPVWLIVSSNHQQEVMALYEAAVAAARAEGVKPDYVVCSPRNDLRLPVGVRLIDYTPASMLFWQADKIITACGPNLMRETEPFASRHIFVPFDRPYDDQHSRAELRRRAHRKVA